MEDCQKQMTWSLAPKLRCCVDIWWFLVAMGIALSVAGVVVLGLLSGGDTKINLSITGAITLLAVGVPVTSLGALSALLHVWKQKHGQNSERHPGGRARRLTWCLTPQCKCCIEARVVVWWFGVGLMIAGFVFTYGNYPGQVLKGGAIAMSVLGTFYMLTGSLAGMLFHWTIEYGPTPTPPRDSWQKRLTWRLAPFCGSCSGLSPLMLVAGFALTTAGFVLATNGGLPFAGAIAMAVVGIVLAINGNFQMMLLVWIGQYGTDPNRAICEKECTWCLAPKCKLCLDFRPLLPIAGLPIFVTGIVFVAKINSGDHVVMPIEGAIGLLAVGSAIMAFSILIFVLHVCTEKHGVSPSRVSPTANTTDNTSDSASPPTIVTEQPRRSDSLASVFTVSEATLALPPAYASLYPPEALPPPYERCEQQGREVNGLTSPAMTVKVES